MIIPRLKYHAYHRDGNKEFTVIVTSSVQVQSTLAEGNSSHSPECPAIQKNLSVLNFLFMSYYCTGKY